MDNLQSYSPEELQNMYDVLVKERESKRSVTKGQSPEFWHYEIERQKVLREMERRKMKRVDAGEL